MQPTETFQPPCRSASGFVLIDVKKRSELKIKEFQAVRKLQYRIPFALLQEMLLA